MNLFPSFLFLWVTVTQQTTTAFRPAQAVIRQPSHFYAQKKNHPSRGSQSTQSYAVTVDSSTETDATADVPYLESPLTSSLPSPALKLPGLADMSPQEIEKLMHKVVNGIILAVAFGSAIYAILNIDAGMTRGWTQQEIAMRIPLDTWSSYENALEEQPVVTKTIINVVIYLLGDWLSQTAFSKKNILDFDALRTLRNGFIGLCFGPLVVEYYQFSDHILPVEGGLTNRICKILMDQTIYLSVKCSIYIMAVGVLQGDSVETAAQNVKDKLKGILFTAWKFWPLVHCITYSVIPAQHRILWVNMVDLVWNAILATISQKDVPVEEDAETLSLEADLSLLEDTFPLVASGSEAFLPQSGEQSPQLHFVAMAEKEKTMDDNQPLP
uniref:Peroxisomal membrane protein MPV17 n=1 Tax=Amphora coffeiformis TaxID=265554 RepID=A0A7S3P3K9_9STRA|mmetsp:Transcript_5443/g.10845  ORF Transcript_5443/g.10845 Transcript_5443/m.10845 type:complete len:383 (+) Transcript_5443:1-1149(+)|eukprot:scaffold370_cov176-Amphora_coffeaeformis.AAC.6